MQFHEFTNLRQLALRSGSEELIREAKELNGEEFAEHTFQDIFSRENLDAGETTFMMCAEAETLWYGLERPYYNCWPIVVELADTVRLDVPYSAVELPFAALLLRFARGHEPFGICTAMIQWSSPQNRHYVNVVCVEANTDRTSMSRPYNPDDSVEDWMNYVTSSKDEIISTKMLVTV